MRTYDGCIVAGLGIRGSHRNREKRSRAPGARQVNMHRLAPHARVKSFLCAVRGIVVVLRTQPNAWIMVVAAVCTVATGLLLRVSLAEWCVLMVAVFLVFVAELINSAVEYLTDLVAPEYAPLARDAKDAAAGAVLLASIIAFVAGSIVVVPKLMALLGLR